MALSVCVVLYVKDYQEVVAFPCIPLEKAWFRTWKAKFVNRTEFEIPDKVWRQQFSQTLSDVMADHHHRCALKLCRAKNPSKFLDHWTVKKCVSSHLKHRWMENSSFPGKCRLSNHHKGALRAVCQDLRKKQKSLLHLLDEDFVAKNVWSCCSRSGDFVLSCRAGQNSTVSQAAQIWLKLRLK